MRFWGVKGPPVATLISCAKAVRLNIRKADALSSFLVMVLIVCGVTLLEACQAG
jgi:hypothetical protein